MTTIVRYTHLPERSLRNEPKTRLPSETVSLELEFAIKKKKKKQKTRLLFAFERFVNQNKIISPTQTNFQKINFSNMIIRKR